MSSYQEQIVALRVDVDNVAGAHAELLRDLAAEREVLDGRLEILEASFSLRLDGIVEAISQLELRVSMLADVPIPKRKSPRKASA